MVFLFWKAAAYKPVYINQPPNKNEDKNKLSWIWLRQSVCFSAWGAEVFSLFHFVFSPSPLIYYRQHCVFGDDGRGLLLGRHGWQGGQKAVSAHLHVHKWLLRLPVVFCAGLWLLPALSHDSWLRVSLFPAPRNLWYIFKILNLSSPKRGSWPRL